MKPLGGGLLEDARLCFRYLAQFPDVVPDPGIEKLDQMKEILAVLKIRGALTPEENRRIEEHRASLGKTWCHRCDYCQPCPEGISISTVLTAKSFVRRMPRAKVMAFAGEPFKAVEGCTECRECVERCPYDLDIPALLKAQRVSWEGFLHTSAWA
jgi:hypothetical protein